MTQEEMRMAIAEMCGWYCINDSEWTGRINTSSFRLQVPNYSNDLNAIQDVIMSQPQLVRDRINFCLIEMMRPFEAHVLDRTINATAFQRAEAFLRALNKMEIIKHDEETATGTQSTGGGAP